MSRDYQKQSDLLNQYVVQLYKQGNYKEAIKPAEQACLLVEQHLGKKHPHYATSLNNLAMLYKLIGKFEKAEPLYREAVDIDQQVLGREHPNYATSLDNLATLYTSMGRYKEAEPLYREALGINEKTLGKEHRDYATSLNNLATLYNSMGEFEEAEPLYREAKEIWHKILGNQHPTYATILSNLAESYRITGRYKEAEPLYREAKEIKEKVLGNQHPDYAICLNNLAMFYDSIGRYKEAEPLLIKAKEIWHKVLGNQHPTYATSLNNLAMFYNSMGRRKKAEPLYREAKEIKEKALGNQHPDYATSLNNLAMFYNSMGKFEKAEPLLRKTKKIWHKILGKQHPTYAISLANLATLYYSTGRYKEAEPLLIKAKRIRYKTLGKQHPDYANSLNSLAILYTSMGRYKEAEPLLIKAKRIRYKTLGKQHPDYANSLNRLAELYRVMGRYKRAETLLIKAKEIKKKVLGKKHPTYASTLNDLATLYISMGRYKEAESLFREAKDIKEKAVGKEHPDYAGSLNNLAGLCYLSGKYEEAESLFREAKDIKEKAVGKEHPDYALSLNNLAELYRTTGRYEEAEPLHQEAKEIRHKVLGKEHPTYADSLNNLALLFAATEREVKALELIQQATTIDNKTIGQIFSFSSESQRMDYINKIQPRFHSFLSLVLNSAAKSTDAVHFGLELVLKRKAIGAEALAAQRDTILGGKYPELKTKLRELTATYMQIARNSLDQPGETGLITRNRLLRKLNNKKESLEAKIAQQIPEMNLAQKLKEANPEMVANILPKGSVLIEFVRLDVFDFKATSEKETLESSLYIAFILHAGERNDIKMIELGDAELIDRTIGKFISSIINQLEDNGNRGLGSSHSLPPSIPKTTSGIMLRTMIFDKLLPAFNGSKRLLISPDGNLARLPFEVLPWGDGNRLISEYQISYVGVGRDALRFGTKSSRQATPPLIAADPDFDLANIPANTKYPETKKSDHRPNNRSKDGLHFSPLPGTRIEAENITRLMDSEKPETLLADKALEIKVKSCKSPHILHLATHGFFLTNQQVAHSKKYSLMGRSNYISKLENPLLRSGLALAGANTWLKNGSAPQEAEDGLLTALDVTGLDLLDTELVVLSACDTGLGETKVGEGVFGLRRAFILAGAKTLVMSLWSVDDLSTAILIGRFYTNLLKKKLMRNESLREAQLYTRDIRLEQMRDPWLKPETMERLATNKPKYRHFLQKLSQKPDDYQPFKAVVYWGAFICQGETEPL